MKKSISSHLKKPETIVIILMILLIIFSSLLIFNLRSNAISNFFNGESNQASEVIVDQRSSSSVQFSKRVDIDTTLFANTGEQVVVTAGQGVDTYSETCSFVPEVKTRRLGSAGEVQSGVVVKECGADTKTFYELKWADDTVSFVDADNLSVDGEILPNGLISGLVGFEGVNTDIKVCALEIGSDQEYCNNDISDVDSKQVEYSIELGVGTYFVYARLSGVDGFDKAYFNSCTFEATTVANIDQLCENKDESIKAVKVFIEENEVVEGINITDYRQNVRFS